MPITKRTGSPNRFGAFIAGAVFLLALGCSTTSVPPQQETQQAPPPPVVQPALSVNAVMVGLVDHASHVIWDAATDEKAPKNDKDWEELEHHAIQLAAAGSEVALGGTGREDAGWAAQPQWGEYSKQLTEAALAALDAARNRNQQGIEDVGDRITATCTGCHDRFKPEVPTEGILHPH
jgi:hypothetical protein